MFTDNIMEQLVEYVNNFHYLGIIMMTNFGAERDVNNRICKVRAAFGELQSIWRSSKYFRQTLLYEIENHHTDAACIHRQVFHNHMQNILIK